ncbi:oligoendopeptidase [candidate division GN15 bacterium]|uniref:Oligoendopeptidase n=1 Tax=candidate division GN15 bacterium TaxID=2072418 RepID=A0A855X2X0_9BACT|nr:MAG: oligoendopeptidase [candidate division GN15 bacterium]
MMTPSQKLPAAPNWDLDSIFPGGSNSAEYAAYRAAVKEKLAVLRKTLDALDKELTENSLRRWVSLILDYQKIGEELVLIRGFAGCLMAQNVNDGPAFRIAAEADGLVAEWEKVKVGIESRAMAQSDAAWQMLVTNPDIAPISFYLNELRDNARNKMTVEKEALALDLAVDGYHAWNRIYEKMVGDLAVDFELDGQKRRMSLGQLASIMDNPDRSVRQRAFEKINEAWEPQVDLAAQALNAQAGFRLELYRHRNWQSPVFEPLVLNRLSQASLDAMWDVIARNVGRLKPYIEAKKRLLGIEKFRWYDEFVLCGQSEKLMPFSEAADFVVEQLSRFSPELGDFCRMAIDKRWVEAEDRSGKRAGAFCSLMGPLRQSRVFMTYAGTTDNMFTLAHELGHAYHTFTLKDKPFLAVTYPMGLAETASILNELVTNDSALAATSDPAEKLKLVDQTLQNAYIFFCDLRSRYLFDTAFYAERKNGVVGKERLDELMLQAQRTAFGDLLDESGLHKRFWCTKQHFFMTRSPFYNFPYTVGFLFSNGVYDCAVREGKAFAGRYRALLADTGSMTTEMVAKKHIGVDLTREPFWQSAVDRTLSRMDEFLRAVAAQK